MKFSEKTRGTYQEGGGTFGASKNVKKMLGLAVVVQSSPMHLKTPY